MDQFRELQDKITDKGYSIADQKLLALNIIWGAISVLAYNFEKIGVDDEIEKIRTEYGRENYAQTMDLIEKCYSSRTNSRGLIEKILNSEKIDIANIVTTSA